MVAIFELAAGGDARSESGMTGACALNMDQSQKYVSKHRS